MALNPDACGVIDPSIPQWKRELIIRRRALGRTLQVGSSSVKLTCPAVVAAVRQPESCSGSENIPSTNSPKCSPTAEDSLFSSLNQNRVDFHQGPSSPGSVSNMRLLDACSEVDNLVINNGIDVKSKQSGVLTNNSDTSVSYSLIMGEDKSLNLKKKNSPKSKHETINCVSSRQRIFIEKVQNEGTNGKSNKEEDCLSDSSEELQYGPGIVNKLKTKYLSMTLREQKKHIRPSLSNLRRATSLENMLDGDDNLNEQTKMGADVKVKTGNVNSIDKSTLMGKTVGLNSNCGLRSLGNHRIETMKRAQSMDTLLKSEIRGTIKPIVNENIIIVEKENIGINPSPDSSSRTKSNVRPNTELPPPDVVKQTLKIFETSPKKKVKPAGQGNLAKLVAGFSNPASQPVSSLGNRSIIDRRKVNQNNKPTLSPKPILSPEKLRRTKIGSPKRNQPAATGTVSSASRTPPLSTSNKPVGINNERVKLQLVQNEQSVAERTTATSPKVLSPKSKSPTVTVLTDNDHPSLASQPEKVHSQSLLSNGEKEVSSVHSGELEEIDSHSESSKPVPETALENIRRGGVSMQFSFSSDNSPVSSNKSYLPRPKSPPQALNTSLLKGKLENSPSPTGFVPPRQQGSPQIKQVGIIRPLVSTKIQSNVSSTPALTEQEIEKNLINRVKSIEQPVSKVVVAIKALPDSVVLGSVSADVTNKSGCANSKVKSQGLWDEKVWHANQNTIVFNFSNRKEVPDYIENDGLILKGKRDRPRPGDGGFILLDDSSDPDETCTEAEDLLTSLPPSPCDVTFVGDNVVINGKSNLKKMPKPVKLRIQFNDEATTMFEYPSEASLVEEELKASRGTDEGDAAEASSTAASTSTSTSTSGAPGLSMSLGIPPPDFLPPPVPRKPLPPPPLDKCPPVPPVVKGKAPLPPAQPLPNTGPPVPPRGPRLFKSNSLDESRSKKPTTNPILFPSKGGKEKYFSKKKVRKPKPLVELTSSEKSQVHHDSMSETLTKESVKMVGENKCSVIATSVNDTKQLRSEVAKVCEPDETLSFNLKTENLSTQNEIIISNNNQQEQLKPSQIESTSPIQPEITIVSFEPNNNSTPSCHLDGRKTNELYSEQSQNRFSSGENSISPDENANAFSIPVLTSHLSNKSIVKPTVSNLVCHNLNKDKSFLHLKAKSSKLSLDLKTPKPFNAVQPLMGTKSLTTTLLSPTLDNAPKYSPVYSKPSLVCSNSELTVDPLLSQVLTQKKIPSPTFVNRSVSTRRFLVLEDWPLGGSLGTYTPKQVSASDWQFGVTPVAPPPPANTSANTEEDEHLKPAPPEATVAWSEDTASDLLF